MMHPRRALSRQAGLDAESRAEEFLRSNGYTVLARNFSTQWGEIDIVAREGQTICFVEVKMRSGCSFGSPALAVTRSKQRRIAMAALVFLKQRGVRDRGGRFDVVSMVRLPQEWKIELYRNAFDFPW